MPLLRSALDPNAATTSAYMTKVTRPLAAIVCFAAASLLADDELALRLQPALEAITPDGLLASSARLQSEIKIDKAEVVFVGYGVGASEYGWDDYKDVDVRGKTLLMLIGDPPVPDPKNPSKLDDKMFKGRAMTYYGRWTYKYEIA